MAYHYFFFHFRLNLLHNTWQKDVGYSRFIKQVLHALANELNVHQFALDLSNNPNFQLLFIAKLSLIFSV